MEPQDTLTQIGAIAGTAAAIWLIVRDVVPFAIRSIRPAQEWAKQKRRSREAAREKRETAQLEIVRKTKVDDLRKEFLSATLRLRCIVHSEDRYYPVELNRQRRVCKKLAIQHMAAAGTRLSQGNFSGACRLVRFEGGTLLIQFQTNPPIEERLWVVVRCHPDPAFSGSDGDETWAQLETVLATTLDDQELADVGWEHPGSYISGWRLDTPPFDDGRFVRD